MITITASAAKAVLSTTLPSGEEYTKERFFLGEAESFEPKAVLQQLSVATGSLRKESVLTITLTGGSYMEAVTKTLPYLAVMSYRDFKTKAGKDCYLAQYWRAVFSNPYALDALRRGRISWQWSNTSKVASNWTGD